MPLAVAASRVYDGMEVALNGLGNDANYWRALGEGRLSLPKCAGCKRWVWPAPFRCSECGSWELAWQDVEMKGEVYAWTRVRHPFGGAEALGLPYVVASVALPQANGIRLFGLLEPGDDAAIGLKVTGKVRTTHAFDRDVLAISWSPVA